MQVQDKFNTKKKKVQKHNSSIASVGAHETNNGKNRENNHKNKNRNIQKYWNISEQK